MADPFDLCFGFAKIPAVIDGRFEGPAIDVLAAEEFVVPAPDPALTPEYLDLPSDLVGSEPRDVLAAEEFAMPAPDEARVRRSVQVGPGPARAPLAAIVLLAVMALVVRGALRRRRATQVARA